MSKYTNSFVKKNGRSKFEAKCPSSLQELEDFLAAMIREEIRQLIENSETNPPAPTTRCRECAEVAQYASQQQGVVATMFGSIGYWRAGYICTDCGRTTYPLDERLNPVASLARLRSKISAGKLLPVSELAQVWGLGSLDISAGQSHSSPDITLTDEYLAERAIDTPVPGSNHLQFRLLTST